MVTDGEEAKVQNVARAAHDVCGGVGVGRFLVTSFAALKVSDALSVPWLDASGKEIRLGV